MPKISQRTLLRAPIPIPPLAEQRRIVGKITELMSLCHRLEKQLAVTGKESSRLLEALLRETLNGSCELMI